MHCQKDTARQLTQRKPTRETVYYLSSHEPDAAFIAHTIRGKLKRAAWDDDFRREILLGINH